MAATQTVDTHVTLTQEEKNYLVRVLQNAIGETRVEVHHTHTPQYRERLAGLSEATADPNRANSHGVDRIARNCQPIPSLPMAIAVSPQGKNAINAAIQRAAQASQGRRSVIGTEDAS